jgi:hypothetical protein
LLRIKTFTLGFLLLIVFAGCARQPAETNRPTTQPSPEQKPIASVDVVNASASETAVTRGSASDAVVRLSIKSGYHVNANPASYPYLKATKLEFSPPDGTSVAYITYPPALSRKFPFAEQPLAVYEGETLLTVRVKADKATKAGPLGLTGKLNIQACDEQVCYAPGTIDVTVPLNIK